MTIRKLGEPGRFIPREEFPATEEDPATVSQTMVFGIESLCEALDGAPDEAQHVLFIRVAERNYIYWSDSPQGPWHNISEGMPDL